MIERRLFLSSAASCLLANNLPARGADSAASEPAATPDYADVLGPFPSDYRLFGTSPATGPEEDAARRILASAPRKGNVLETAQYFADLTETNAEKQGYNAQWPVRWNPVIVGFYQSTNLGKAYSYVHGDTTPWCAAFLNWCLAQNGYKTTDSASSGSFRLFGGLGKPTTTPKPGDIIVFKSNNPTAAATGSGHVTFFLSKAPGGFNVLGGNQHKGKKYSSINSEFFSETPPGMVLDSIRALDSVGKA